MFYIILLRLIDRVFGEEATGFRDESINLTLSSVPALPLPPSASSPSVPSPSVSIPVAGRRWIRGGRGGWLALNEGLINAKTTLLLNLFVPNSSLMSIILLRQTPKFSTYVTRKAYEMNLSILPSRLQMKVKNNAFNDCTSVLLSSSLSSVSSYESKFKIVKSSSTIGIEVPVLIFFFANEPFTLRVT